MNITTDSTQEVWHRLEEPGSYEWWYFDAEDQTCGLSIVLIWFAGFAFSPYYMRHYAEWRSRLRSDSPHPGEYAGFSFQLYENGREIVNFIKEGSDGLFDGDSQAIGARFEQNSFLYDPSKDEYHLTIDFTFPARDKRVRGSLLFRPSHRYDYCRNNDCFPGREHRHQWLLSVPKANVEGQLDVDSLRGGEASRRITLQGQGYHDHNFGTMPMHEYIDRWYWGRVYAGRFDLVYYVIFFHSSACKPLAVMMLNDNESGRQLVMERVRFSEDQFSRGLYTPAHGRILTMEEGAVRVEVTHAEALDAGPFYIRFNSLYTMNVDGRRVEDARGISEFLNPAALQSRFMRFFTGCRIWRDGTPSFMYTSYNFFRHQFDWLNRKKL
jgi:carotenoid 1,2-hydratase